LLESAVKVGSIPEPTQVRDALGAEGCVGEHLFGSHDP
jgi:hypothetical protein